MVVQQNLKTKSLPTCNFRMTAYFDYPSGKPHLSKRTSPATSNSTFVGPHPCQRVRSTRNILVAMTKEAFDDMATVAFSLIYEDCLAAVLPIR